MRTVNIPGGQATIRERKDLTVRQQRMVENATMTSLSTMSKLAKVPKLETGIDITSLRLDSIPDLNQEDLNHMNELQDNTIVALLASWTLVTATGEPRPLPTIDTIQDLELSLYEVLAKEMQKDGASLVANQDFGVSPDPKVPISDSGSSNGSSLETPQPLPT